MIRRIEPGGCVPANRWDRLDPPELGRWEPSILVTVVIPAYGGQEDLDRVLAGLAAQSYPGRLLEVLIADDGSEPPITAPSQIRIERQSHDGFGLARARNLGAAAASGEVLIFLDADMVPERRFVEAHARWHHATAGALVMGFRRHTEIGHLTADRVRELVAAGRLSQVAMEHDLGVPDWLEAHFARTEEATQSVPDLFRMVTGGNFSITRADYRALGGTSEAFCEYGGEDRELAFRAQVDGLLFIPERQAFAWHQGSGGWQAEDIEARKAEADTRLAEYIADQSVRPLGTRAEARPTVTVVADTDQDRLHAQLEAGGFRDFEVVAAAEQGWAYSPIRLDVAPGVMFEPGALAEIVRRVRNPQLGRLELRSGDAVLAAATLRRARRRAERCGLAPDDIEATGFGTEAVDAAAVGLSKLTRRRRWRGARRS